MKPLCEREGKSTKKAREYECERSSKRNLKKDTHTHKSDRTGPDRTWGAEVHSDGLSRAHKHALERKELSQRNAVHACAGGRKKVAREGSELGEVAGDTQERLPKTP